MSGDGGPPPLLPAQRALEAALAGVVILAAVWLWTRGLAAPADAGAAPETMERLAALQREGRGGVPTAITTLIGLAALGALGLVFLRALRALRAALPAGEPLTVGRAISVAGAWWAERTAGLRQAAASLTIGHFLVAYGVVQVAQAPAMLLMPPGQVVVDGDVVEVTVASPHEVAPVGTDVKARFAPAIGRMIVVVTGGPVEVDGVTRGPGRLALLDGATLEVGGRDVVVHPPPPAGQLAAVAAAQALSVLVLIAGAALLGGRALLERLGLTTRGLPAELRRGALAFLAVLPIYFVALTLWAALGGALGVPPQGHALVEVLERDGLALAPIVALQAVLLAPPHEELLYRALLVPALARVFGVPGAVLASALVFASAHTGFFSLAPMLVLGTLFAGLYVTSRDRSLVGAITAHALHNGLTLLLVVTVQLA